jgi:hypothetical protein
VFCCGTLSWFAGMFKRLTVSTIVAAVTLVTPLLTASAETPMLRIFLRDGTTLSSYGEYARVDGRLVFSMPFGQQHGEPRLQLVSLPAAQVDWIRTDRYREAVRAAQYAETRGESDFTLVTGEVAGVLNEIALTPNSANRLALADEARRRLAAWPAEHYGYRASDVREILSVLDEAVSELRVAAGEQTFDLNLVAMADTAPQEHLLPNPTAQEIIAQALSIAEVGDVPSERTALLREAIDYIDRSAPAPGAPAWTAAREFAQRRLDRELAADRAYAQMRRELTTIAGTRAARADVRGLEKLIASVPRRDTALGHQRPDQVQAMMTALQERLESARHLRLARDQWRLRSATYRSYSSLIRLPLVRLERMRPALEEIRRLAGPDAATLSRVEESALQAARQLRVVVPPGDLASVHSVLQSACQMADNAARTRLQAITSGDMTIAWNASAAAAGSLMLAAQARDELARHLAAPRLR